MNYATNQNMNNSRGYSPQQKYKDKSYLPEALTGAAIAGLAGAAMLKGKQNVIGGLADGAAKGFQNSTSKALKSSKAMKTVKPYVGLGKKVVGKSKSHFDAYAKFETKFKKAAGIPLGADIAVGRKNPEAFRKMVYQKFLDEEKVLGEFASRSELKWRKLNNIPGSRKLNGPEAGDLSSFVEREWADYTKTSGNPNVSNLWRSPVEKLKTGKKQDLGDNLVNGIGQGAALGGTSLLVHALGQKYFDESDNDKVREIVRNSYRSTGVPYAPRQQVVNPVERAQAYTQPKPSYIPLPPTQAPQAYVPKPQTYMPRPQTTYVPRPQTYVTKQANEEQEVLKFSDKVIRELKNAGNVGLGGVIDAAAITSIPLAASGVLKKDIKNGFIPLENGEDLPGTITIDVPLESLKKQASSEAFLNDTLSAANTADVPEEVLKGFAKLKSDPEFIKFLEKRRDTFIRVMPWTVTAGAVMAASNKKRGLNESIAGKPIPEGMARITIQTKNTPTANNDDMLMRRASEESTRDNDVSDDAQTILDAIRESIEASTSQVNPEEGIRETLSTTPSEGIVGRHYQQRTLS